MSEESQPKYEKRLVAFLDILGFRAWIERSATDRKVLEQMLEAIDAMKRVDSNLEDSDIFHQDKQLTQFSDSIVISYRVTSPSAVFDLLLDLLFLIIDATDRGFLLRGGVAIGEMIHTDRNVIGPALISAYELEKNIARYPRVIVDSAGYNQLLTVAHQYPAPHHDGAQEKNYITSLLVQDEDGNYFLDYVSFQGVVVVAGVDQENYPAYFSRLCKYISDGLENPDSSVVEKYLWLEKRYTSQRNQIIALPPEHPWRQNNPEEYEWFSSTGDLTRRAEAARNLLNQIRARDPSASRSLP